MTKLRVLIGTSLDSLQDITDSVNTNRPVHLSSDLFDGQIVACIKGFNGTTCDYFSRDDRQGVTWSIQVKGRFLKDFSSDDILFGNIFERPLTLPWGSSVALKFMSYIDPTLEHDLTSNTKPWALSPLIATMPHFAHTRSPDDPFPPTHSISDDTSQLHLALVASESSGSSSPRNRSSSDSSSSSGASSKNKTRNIFRSKKASSVNFPSASQRRSYFAHAFNRAKITFGPEDTLITDFCYGFIDFSPNLSLRLPGGISFDLMRYWDRQPVRFVCCQRPKNESEPWGDIFWCVSVEACDD